MSLNVSQRRSWMLKSSDWMQPDTMQERLKSIKKQKLDTNQPSQSKCLWFQRHLVLVFTGPICSVESIKCATVKDLECWQFICR